MALGLLQSVVQKGVSGGQARLQKQEKAGGGQRHVSGVEWTGHGDGLDMCVGVQVIGTKMRVREKGMSRMILSFLAERLRGWRCRSHSTRKDGGGTVVTARSRAAAGNYLE